MFTYTAIFTRNQKNIYISLTLVIGDLSYLILRDIQYLVVVLICISLITTHIENIFLCISHCIVIDCQEYAQIFANF